MIRAATTLPPEFFPYEFFPPVIKDPFAAHNKTLFPSNSCRPTIYCPALYCPTLLPDNS